MIIVADSSVLSAQREKIPRSKKGKDSVTNHAEKKTSILKSISNRLSQVVQELCMCIRDEHVCVHVCGACVQPGLRKHSSEPRMFLLLVSLYLVSGSLKALFFPLHFRYGFGEAGKPKFGIEPNAELTYEVTLKSFEKVRKANFSKVVVGLCTYPSLAVH